MKKLEKELKEEDKNTHIKNIGEKYFETIRKKTSLWQEYIYNLKQNAINSKVNVLMKATKVPIKIQIPLKENIKYKNIESFEEHSLSNNLALEMIIRNKNFQKYMFLVEAIEIEFENKNLQLKEKYYKELQRTVIEKFGFNIKDSFDLLACHPFVNERIIDSVENIGNEILILNPPFISDFENGLQKVIDFYLKKQQLFVLIPSEFEKIDHNDLKNYKEKLYIKIINPLTLKNDYIPYSIYQQFQEKLNRVDNFFYRLPPSQKFIMESIDDELLEKYLSFLCIPIITFGKEKLISLSIEEIPIEFLDKDIYSLFTEEDLIDPSIKNSEVKSIFPNLKFRSSKSINFNINLEQSASLNEKIRNLQSNSEKIRSFADNFDMEIEKIEKVKNSKHISKTKELKNRDYTNALFIYDLYNIIGKEFGNKILELEKEANEDKIKIKNNPYYDSKESKEHEYDKIDIKLEKNKSLFSKNYLDIEIQKITNLEISKIRGLHSLMKEYIEECKFKNIILGK